MEVSKLPQMIEKLSNYDWKPLFKAGKLAGNIEVSDPYVYVDNDRLKIYFGDYKPSGYADPENIQAYFNKFKPAFFESVLPEAECLKVHVLSQLEYYHSLDWSDIRENGYRFDPHILYAIVEFREEGEPVIIWQGYSWND